MTAQAASVGEIQMNIIKTAICVIAVFCASVIASPAGRAQAAKDQGALNQVLHQMETVGKSFKSFSAKFVQKRYTAALKEFDTPESGEFYYSRAADGSALIRQEFTAPASRILTIKGGTATLYQPGIKQAQIYSLGKNKDKAEYLALGIGQSPAKLQETFNIQLTGTENVNGTPASILVLKPKNPKAAALAASVTLWIQKSNGVPIQEKLEEQYGDYTLIQFSDEKINQKIPDSKFDQKLPAGVEKQVIQ
jgi:outer membrane lipoprotein-sorting protein